ncbi:MAG: hypothetical protein WCV90_04310 [Candidatus Woesearchaeota archaeon]|jgi:hypothetical protein
MNVPQLRQKGWSEKEILRAKSILERAEVHDVFFARMVFWSALVVIVFANLLISLIMIPFLIFLNSWVLYSIVALLGLMIGFVYNFLITDIKHLTWHHHLLAGILLPVIALINMIVMVLFSNRYAEKAAFSHTNSPWIIGIIFAVMFILPALIDTLRRR